MNMPLVLLNRRRRGFTAFSPSTLFALAEPGVWFDPSDLTTIFQDPAGTTPVTAPGNTVGLMLDKSRGLALGAELVTNGDFSAGTDGWTADGSNSIDVVGNELRVTLNSATFSGTSGTAYSLVVGRRYSVTVTARQGTTTQGFIARFGTGSGEGDSTPFTSTSSTTKTFSFIATSTTTTPRIVTTSSSGTGTLFVDNISVRELAGNHATQATIAARPTYSIEPVGGRRNLLLQTEAFDTASWTKSNATASAGTITATASSGFHCVTQAATTSGSFVVASVRAKPGTSNFVWITATPSFGGANYATAVANLATGEVTKTQSGGTLTGATAAISGLDAQGFYRVTLSAANPTSVMTEVIGVSNSATPTITSYGSVEFAASGTESIITGGAQGELGSTATPYQRVTTQHDVTEAGVASLGYLYFDGVNDAMVTSTITPGTDKAQVFAGVRKLSDATSAILAEFSATFDTNAGSFALLAPSSNGSNSYRITSRGSTPSSAGTGVFATAPNSSVLTGLADISGDTATLRRNGSLVETSAADQGTGNFLAYPLYLGARGGTSVFFTGHIYSLVVRFGANLDGTLISNTETWVAGKTGVTL